jgi:xylulokinase
MENDYVMTYSPEKDKTPYLNAYQDWKKELDLILSNES